MGAAVRRINTKELDQMAEGIYDVAGLRRDEFARLSSELVDYAFRQNRPAFHEFTCPRLDFLLVFKVDMKNVQFEGDAVSMEAYISSVFASPIDRTKPPHMDFVEFNKLLAEAIESPAPESALDNYRTCS